MWCTTGGVTFKLFAPDLLLHPINAIVDNARLFLIELGPILPHPGAIVKLRLDRFWLLLGCLNHFLDFFKINSD